MKLADIDFSRILLPEVKAVIKNQIGISYTKWGLTEGAQSMPFNSISETKTELIHFSRFKGKSAFRDKFYPFFHSMVMKKMHEGCIENIELS